MPLLEISNTFSTIDFKYLFYLSDLSRCFQVNYSSVHIVWLCHSTPTVYLLRLPKLDRRQCNSQSLDGYIMECVVGAAVPKCVCAELMIQVVEGGANRLLSNLRQSCTSECEQ